MNTLLTPAAVATATTAPVLVRSGDLKADVTAYVAMLQVRQDAYDTLNNHKFFSVFSATFGVKYVRIVKSSVNGSSSSAFAFLDREGNVYKPDGWKRPAAHVRGNIYNVTDALQGTGIWGAAYLR